MSDPQLPNPHDDPDARPVVLWGILGSLVVVAIVIVLTALVFKTEQKLVERRVYAVKYDEGQAELARQQAALHSYRWVDKNKGIVAIPIDRAIELTVREFNRKQNTTHPGTAAATEQP